MCNSHDDNFCTSISLFGSQKFQLNLMFLSENDLTLFGNSWTNPPLYYRLSHYCQSQNLVSFSYKSDFSGQNVIQALKPSAHNNIYLLTTRPHHHFLIQALLHSLQNVSILRKWIFLKWFPSRSKETSLCNILTLLLIYFLTDDHFDAVQCNFIFPVH